MRVLRSLHVSSFFRLNMFASASCFVSGTVTRHHSVVLRRVSRSSASSHHGKMLLNGQQECTRIAILGERVWYTRREKKSLFWRAAFGTCKCFPGTFFALSPAFVRLLFVCLLGLAHKTFLSDPRRYLLNLLTQADKMGMR